MVFSSIVLMKFRGTFFIKLFNSIKYYGNFIYEIKRIHSHLSHFSNQTTTIDNDHLFWVQEKLKTLSFLSVIIKAWIYFNLLLLFNYFFLKLNVEIRYFSNMYTYSKSIRQKEVMFPAHWNAWKSEAGYCRVSFCWLCRVFLYKNKICWKKLMIYFS